ncbi:Asparagine--tRNA ligase [Podosphaera aphanis]|nr:Asparagine--tRNA ligase [Podosphaera aphanis]
MLQQSQVTSSECQKLNDLDEVVISGYIRSIRNQKQRSFASIGDGSSIQSLQALLTPAQAKGLSYGTAVRVTGCWKPSPNPSAQSHELHVSKLDVLGPVDSSYPLQKKYQTPEYLRTIPHLRTRIPFNCALLRFRSDAIAIITKTLSEMSFTQTHPPIITSSDCEGAGEVFHVGTALKEQPPHSPEQNFFRSQKYLTVSSQLHLEALSQSVGNVWTLSPTFRAEKSDTTRHLSEFYMLEAEMSFIDSLDDVMQLVKRIMLPVVQNLYNSQTGQDLLKGPLGEKELKRRWDGITTDWKRITYTEAIKILQSSLQVFEHEPKWGLSLQTEHEKYISSVVGANSDSISPVFVTHYPRSLKPFYMLASSENNENQETVDCFDLLVPEVCEIAGGSMREHRLQSLITSMFTNGLIPSTTPSDQDFRDLKWYVDLRKWGSVPHGGFGLGFDRLLSYLAGVPHIREMVTFPRWVGRCDC